MWMMVVMLQIMRRSTFCGDVKEDMEEGVQGAFCTAAPGLSLHCYHGYFVNFAWLSLQTTTLMTTAAAAAVVSLHTACESLGRLSNVFAINLGDHWWCGPSDTQQF